MSRDDAQAAAWDAAQNARAVEVLTSNAEAEDRLARVAATGAGAAKHRGRANYLRGIIAGLGKADA